MMQKEVLEFWFGFDGEPGDLVKNVWFAKRDDLDAEIEEKFGEAVERGLAGEYDDWAEDPDGALALVILLDQFTRNIHRDTPKAFAGDPKALATSRHVIDNGWDTEMSVFQRAFVYMPLEHSETDEAQEQSIASFERLVEDAPEKHRQFAEMFLDYAHKHKDIVDRFGRYPHRNEILGRASTPEEVEFLKQPGSSF